jgi:predicted nucleotidyltransferase
MDILEEIRGHKAEIAELCQRYGVERLSVFGSAVTGAFRPDVSDIDFLVEFTSDATGPGYFRRFYDFKRALEDMFHRPVDLVVESAIRNPYFKDSVERTRTLLYAA